MGRPRGRRPVLTRFEDVQQIAQELCRLRNAKAVLLFGSHARDEQNALSDVDLCVVGPLSARERAEALAYSSDNLDISIFRDLPISIRFRIVQEGKPLAIKDRDYLDDERYKTIQEYLDFKPVIDKYVREVLRAER